MCYVMCIYCLCVCVLVLHVCLCIMCVYNYVCIAYVCMYVLGLGRMWETTFEASSAKTKVHTFLLSMLLLP